MLWIFFKATGLLILGVKLMEIHGNYLFSRKNHLFAEIFERYCSIPVVGHEVNLSELKI